MEQFVKDFVCNLMFVTVSPILYFFYWVKRGKKEGKLPVILQFLCLSTSMIFCMLFGFNYLGQFSFDFRMVPLVLGVLYGGPMLGGALFLILVGYRYMIGGDGFYVGSIVSLSVYLCLVFLQSQYQLKSRLKIRYAVVISALLIPIPIIFSFAWIGLITYQVAFIFAFFRFIQSLVILLMVEAIEFTIQQVRMQRELQEMEKFRVVSEIAASVSHEIRNPLTTVKGMLQLIDETDLPIEKKHAFITLALTELDSAIKIITDYLTFAKPQFEHVKTIELAIECKHVLNVLTSYANMHNVDLTGNLDTPCFIEGDSQKLRQSLINLLKNSIEASENKSVEISLFNLKEQVVIYIQDTGCGMTKEQMNRLGSPYYTTKEKGTGLGTMVAFSIIKAMNGSISIQSENGKGSLFTLTFPASPKGMSLESTETHFSRNARHDS